MGDSAVEYRELALAGDHVLTEPTDAVNEGNRVAREGSEWSPDGTEWKPGSTSPDYAVLNSGNLV